MNIGNRLNAVLSCASLFGMPLAASAQQSPQPVTATRDVSSGIDKTEAEAIHRMAEEFPLRLTFPDGSRKELSANVPVATGDAGRNQVFALPNGRLLLVLPDAD
ncbi:MAG TPA: hypothetical protein VGC70_00210 [Burkholderiales bacterium]|jgi:hypothetical protein